MNLAHISQYLLAGLVGLGAMPTLAADDNVYGSIVFQRADNWAKSGWATNRYVDEMERFGAITQIAKVELDVPAGKVRGFHSVLADSIETTTTIAQWQPQVKIVAPAGASPDDPVLLDLRVTLNASFLAGDFSAQGTYAVSTFTAELAPYFAFASPAAWRAQVVYDYYWRRDFSGDDFHHRKAASLNSFGCAACIAEVIVPDPLNEIRNGFHDITLRVVMPFVPESVFVPYLRIKGESSVLSHAAVGDWMDTATFGYLLPAGYALATADGNLLDAWNLSPVPEAQQHALLAAGLSLIVLAVRWRRKAPLR